MSAADERKLESIGLITALRRGTVPEAGLSRLAVGLETEEEVISSQLSFAAAGHADCKFLRGEYGSGKTFVIARASEIALGKKFVVSHVVISPDTPLHKLQAVYAKICSGLTTPTETHALKSIIDTWIFGIEDRLIETGIDENDPVLAELTAKEIESSLERVAGFSSGLAAAVRAYYIANNSGDFAAAQAAIGWISGDSTVANRSFKLHAGIRGAVSETDALMFLKGIAYLIRQAGFSGLFVSFDEVETMQNLTRPLREKGYINLRQIIDMTDKNEIPGCYLLFAGTPAFFESAKGIRSLPALYDRISIISDDEFSNPLQTQIVLSKFNAEKLEAAAYKVVDIYSEGFGRVDTARISPAFITAMIAKITSRFGGRVDVVPRLFLREFVDVLDKCALYKNYSPMEKYAFAPTGETQLKEEEKAVMEVEW